MRIIKQSEIVETVEYFRKYVFADNDTCGFMFPCDAGGKITRLNDAAESNYAQCDGGYVDEKRVINKGIVIVTHQYREPAIGLCNHCNGKVYLDRFTSACEGCDAEYNSAGQELAPRECWGEETNEHHADIARIR